MRYARRAPLLGQSTASPVLAVPRATAVRMNHPPRSSPSAQPSAPSKSHTSITPQPCHATHQATACARQRLFCRQNATEGDHSRNLFPYIQVGSLQEIQVQWPITTATQLKRRLPSPPPVIALICIDRHAWQISTRMRRDQADRHHATRRPCLSPNGPTAFSSLQPRQSAACLPHFPPVLNH